MQAFDRHSEAAGEVQSVLLVQAAHFPETQKVFPVICEQSESASQLEHKPKLHFGAADKVQSALLVQLLG